MLHESDTQSIGQADSSVGVGVGDWVGELVGVRVSPDLVGERVVGVEVGTNEGAKVGDAGGVDGKGAQISGYKQQVSVEKYIE